MHSELLNLYLFALAIAKESFITGLTPVLFVGLLMRRGVPQQGKTYKIGGHWLGDFIGRVESVNRDFAEVFVVDPMIPNEKTEKDCCFPRCQDADFHDGEHDFPRVHEGAVIHLVWTQAKWKEVA